MILEIYKKMGNNIEKFEEAYLTYKTIQINKPISYITQENNIYDKTFVSLPTNYPYIKYTDELDKSNIKLSNTFDFYKKDSKNKVITITKSPNMCIFFANNKRINEIINLFDDQYQFTLIPEIKNIKDNTKIGYLYDYEKDIIIYILKSLDIELHTRNIELISIKSKDIIDNLFTNNVIDIFFYFNSKDSELLTDIMTKDYSIINYDKMNMDILKTFIPFGRVKNIIIKNNFEDNIYNINNQIAVDSLLIDNLIYEVNESSPYSKYIAQIYDNYVINNYYSTFFNFIEFSKENNDYTGIFNIEEFENNNKQIEHKVSLIENKQDIQMEEIKNVDKDIPDILYYKINTNKADNSIEFQQYDILNIESYDEIYNNKFFIHEIKHDKNGQINSIISKYILIYQINTDDIIKLDNSKSSIDYIIPVVEFNMLNENNLVYILGINMEAIYSDNKFKVLNKSKENLENQFVCFEDQSITDKNICEGDKNIDGTSKPKYTWDRRCVNNSECDFYLSNKNYLNKRGGCKNGFCELPLGLKRKGFRKYELSNTSYPICIGCKESDAQKDCCKKQETDPSFSSPNYAFDGDLLVNLESNNIITKSE